MAVCLLSSCKKDESGFKFYDTWISVKCGENATKAQSNAPQLFGASQRLSADSICRIKELTIMCHHVDASEKEESTYTIDSVDIATHKFLLPSYIVFALPQGELVTDFISDFTDLVIVYPFLDKLKHWHYDTVGYIKNCERLETGSKILSLYEQKKYDEIYAMFNDLFIWYPCTGAEYRQLRKRGEN